MRRVVCLFRVKLIYVVAFKSFAASQTAITDCDHRLRERGTNKVYLFIGERKQVRKPAGAPAWIPAKIWKPNVKKVGIEKLKKI
jgi:hypothetical protein